MICMKIIFCAAFAVLTCNAQFRDSNTHEEHCATSLPRSINNFGAELTRTLGGSDNLFISPMSIYTALAMTYLGTNGRTAQQMEEAFKLEENGLQQGQLHESFRNLLDIIRNSNDDYSLLLANGIFPDKSYVINQTYVANMQTFYNALVQLLDFAHDGEEAKNEINRFVSENTQNKLNDFLQQPLDSTTVLALLNAIYFKGVWQTQFPEDRTRDEQFHKSDGSTKSVRLMVLENTNFRYFDDRTTGYSFLELPYKGGHISMLLALPHNENQVPNLDMSSETLCRINSSMRSTKMTTVQIPRFQLKYRKELVNTLQQLGIADLFNNAANLTRISSTGDLKVSTIVHEAVIEVNEQGSEAAAATGVFITRMSFSLNEFIADHPFAFYIVDKRNGLILFSGRVAEP